MSPVEHLLPKLTEVKRSGEGWSARCPAHDDRKASLSVGEGDDGRALVKCHAGCPTYVVMAAVDLTMADRRASVHTETVTTDCRKSKPTWPKDSDRQGV